MSESSMVRPISTSGAAIFTNQNPKMEELSQKGLDQFNGSERILWNKQALAENLPQAYAKLADSLGYLIGPYDSSHSIHETGKEQWITAKFKVERITFFLSEFCVRTKSPDCERGMIKSMIRILWAEDERDLQKIIRLYLEKEGFSVTVADNGKIGLDLLCENTYDLAILNWMMPVMDGITVCREIHRLGLPVRVMMLTAKDTVEDEIAGLSCGADDYIRKPFEPKVLILRIKKLFRLEEVIVFRDLHLNRQAQNVTLSGREQVAGFKNIHTGIFKEAMLISDSRDMDEFLEKYDISIAETTKEWGSNMPPHKYI